MKSHSESAFGLIAHKERFAYFAAQGKVCAKRHERTEVKVNYADCPINQTSLNAKINPHKN